MINVTHDSVKTIKYVTMVQRKIKRASDFHIKNSVQTDIIEWLAVMVLHRCGTSFMYLIKESRPYALCVYTKLYERENILY